MLAETGLGLPATPDPVGGLCHRGLWGNLWRGTDEAQAQNSFSSLTPAALGLSGDAHPGG